MEIEFYRSLMNILNLKHFLLVFPLMKNSDIKHGIRCGSWIGLCCEWCAGDIHLPGAGTLGHCGILAEFFWWKPRLYPIWGGLESQPLFNDWIMRGYQSSSSLPQSETALKDHHMNWPGPLLWSCHSSTSPILCSSVTDRHWFQECSPQNLRISLCFSGNQV